MKIGLLVALICCTVSVYSQTDTDKERRIFIQQLLTAAAQSPEFGHFNTTRRPDIKIPAWFLTDIDSLREYVKQPPIQFPSNKGTRNNLSAKTNELCKDTSYRHLIGVYNGSLYVSSVSQTSDDAILVSLNMVDSTDHTSMGKAYGLLIKLDNTGQVIWIKQFEDLVYNTYSVFYCDNAFELPNHDILCVGMLSNNGNSSFYRTMVYRLTPNGDIIWSNSLKNTIGIFNSAPGSFSYYIASAVEGLSGDIILCGTSRSNSGDGKIETVTRLNNTGQLVWDANYGNHNLSNNGAGAEGISAFVENGKIVLVGLSHGSGGSGQPAINFLTLDYNNGSTLSKRFFKPVYTDFLTQFSKGFTYYHNRYTRLSNGHMLFYGKLFSDFIGTAAIKDHFGVVEFDASYNLVNAYTISSPVRTGYDYGLLRFDPSGQGLISILEGVTSYSQNLYFGAFKDLQFQNQRKVLDDGGLPGRNGFTFLKDNGYAFVQTYFTYQPGFTSYFEFRKMHNSDTSSKCLGTDTTLFRFLPLNIVEDPSYVFLDDNEPNKLVTMAQNISQTDTLSTTIHYPCKQENYCDTVKIHGNPVICGNSSSILFTAFKNKECGSIVQWNIDNNAIDSLHVINDTTANIWFKNANWQGKLYATLPAGACYTGTADSVTVSIVRAQDKINLGPDASLCKQNSMVLHAGKNYTSYLWQDGSTDSLLTVVAPGIYWVKAGDLCGNNFIDSITITPYDVSVNIGPDRIKCNADTIQLHAPAGFINYTWSNNYNISSAIAQNVVVNPLLDTFYYLKAEKFPDCFAYDTVKIQVNNSQPIQLGPDKSFCSGDSAIIDAGGGFMQYKWSDGSLSQQIKVFSTGSYSVIGTANNGCKSYDTLRIVNVWQNPIVSLGDITELCTGATKILSAGNFASYLWQNGSNAQTFAVTAPGTYYVTVKDNNNCTGSDTVKITRMLPLPANFLPGDTSVCNYGSLQIRPLNSFPHYVWSTSNVSDYIIVKTPGTYWLQVTDANNCTGRDSIEVGRKDCITGFYIPNAFTPHKNGHNDDFKPILGGVVRQYQFSIYNRWGQLVFSTRELYTGWDGAIAGLQQNTGTFVWVCTYQFEGEPVTVKRGTVLLIH